MTALLSILAVACGVTFMLSAWWVCATLHEIATSLAAIVTFIKRGPWKIIVRNYPTGIEFRHDADDPMSCETAAGISAVPPTMEKPPEPAV